jgi:hypothetical protein
VSQEQLETVRVLIERWNTGDRDTETIARYFDPAILLESPLASVSGAPYEGHDGIVRWMHDLDDQFSEWTIGTGDIRQADGRVIALATVSARGRSSGAPLQFDSAAVFDFASDGRIARIDLRLDVGGVLKAVGLEE